VRITAYYKPAIAVVAYIRQGFLPMTYSTRMLGKSQSTKLFCGMASIYTFASFVGEAVPGEARTGLPGKQTFRIGEAFKLERITKGVAEEECSLLARLSRKADFRLKHKNLTV